MTFKKVEACLHLSKRSAQGQTVEVVYPDFFFGM